MQGTPAHTRPEPGVEHAALDPDRAAVLVPGLRGRTARGTIVNAAFLVAVELLRTLRGFVVAGIIAVGDYGLFGILVVVLGTLLALKSVGVGDKFVQQAEGNQEEAFQKALTIEMGLALIFSALFVVAGPLAAAIYDQDELFALSAAMAALPPALALQAPQWIYYRRMDFVRQRLLQAVDPVTVFIVSVPLAIAGFGVWSLVLGTLAGAWVAAIAAILACPYRLRPRFDRGTARVYLSFSWPLFAGAAAALVVAQSTTIVGLDVVGLAGVGAIALAGTIVQYADRADQIVTGTMYPALCAIQDRAEVFAEAFVKSNRLVMIWAFPVGAVLALFGPDLVPGLLGEKWSPAVILVQAFGLAAAANQIAFNWTAFYQARGETRPVAVFGGVTALVYLAAAIPLLAAYDLDGFAVGMGIATLAGVAVRLVYVKRLFPSLPLARLVARSALPAVTASALVLLLRHGLDLDSLAAQAAVFAGALLLITWASERALVREAFGYLSRPAPA
jgi:O-antigen/teichoic acid export membrane protein